MVEWLAPGTVDSLQKIWVGGELTTSWTSWLTHTAGAGGSPLTKGAGRLAPKEVRELEIDLHFPRKVMSGKTYRGTWSISGADLEVVIEIAGRLEAKRGVHAEK